MAGYWGRVLHVDVSTGDHWDEDLPDDVLRSFVGGIGLGTYLPQSSGAPATVTATTSGTPTSASGCRRGRIRVGEKQTAHLGLLGAAMPIRLKRASSWGRAFCRI